jgi:hypothetical protein
MHAVRADVLQAVADIAADSDKMATAAENAVPLKDDSAADADSATGESLHQLYCISQRL